MRIKATLFKGLILALAVALIPVVAVSAQKITAGSSCKVLKQKITYQNKVFTCVKSGKKLVWDKGVAVKKPTVTLSPSPTPSQTLSPSPTPTVTPTVMPTPSPTPTVTPTPSPTVTPTPSPKPTPTPSPKPTASPTQTPTPTPGIKQARSTVVYSAPSLPSEDIALCKIKNAGGNGPRPGFPATTPLYKGTGVVKWALVPLDFSDLPGEANFIARVQKEMDFASDWAENTSEGQLKIEWMVHKNWIRMPGLSRDYAIAKSDNNWNNSPTQQSVCQRAIAEADKFVDFTGIQAVQFILPSGQSIIEYGVKSNIGFDVVRNYVTGEGTRIDLFSIPSTFSEEPNSGRNYWSWWMYHFVVGLGVPKYGGSTATPLHSYLIQGSTEGERELSGWIRFLIGWMPENRVYCRTAANLSKVDVTLVPLTDNKSQGIKLAVIPLSETKALVLESRRVNKFACITNTERSGVLAYIFDSTLGQQDEYFKAIAPSGRSIENYSCYASRTIDFLLHQGDKVTYDGITIEMVAHGDYDKVKITKN